MTRAITMLIDETTHEGDAIVSRLLMFNQTGLNAEIELANSTMRLYSLATLDPDTNSNLVYSNTLNSFKSQLAKALAFMGVQG